jgi:azurin
MKTTVGLLAIAVVLLGCSRHSANRLKIITINSDDSMKFDPASFEVNSDQVLALRHVNVGKLPKEKSAHNWVLLTRDASASRFVELGASSPEREYINWGQDQSYVLVKSGMLGPGESNATTFTAEMPDGQYEYVCTFPGHYAAGEKGEMIVRSP